jgi:hypothetical protein
LIVKGLNWPWNEIIAANQTLFIVLVFLVHFTNLSAFFIVGNGGKIKSEDGWGLLKKDTDVLLKIVHRKIFTIFLFAFLLLFANLRFGIYFRLATGHEAFFLVQRATIFYL